MEQSIVPPANHTSIPCSAESGFRLGRIRNKWLQKCVADIGAVTIAGIRPDMVEERTVGPAAGLFQQETGRTRTPLFRAEQIIGPTGPKEHRPKTENQSSDRFFR